MRSLFLTCCCVALLAGCSGQPAPQPEGEEVLGPGRFPHSVIHKTIAPWDGHALQLFLSEKPMAKRKEVPPYVSIRIYSGASEVSKQRVRVEGTESRRGQAMWIKGPAEDTPLDWAEIDFEEIQEGKPVKGKYTIAFPDGKRERGRFEAVWWPSEARGG